MKLYNLLLIVSLVFSLKPWWNWNSFNPFSYFRRSSYKGECLETCKQAKNIKLYLDDKINLKKKYELNDANFNNLVASIEDYESKFKKQIAIYIRCLMLTAAKNIYESKHKRNGLKWDKLHYNSQKKWLIDHKEFIVDKMFKYNKIDKKKSINCIISLQENIIKDLFSDENLNYLLSIS